MRRFIVIACLLSVVLHFVTGDGVFTLSYSCGGTTPKGLSDVMYRSGNKTYGVVEIAGAKSWNLARTTCLTMFNRYSTIANSDIAAYKNAGVQSFFENFSDLSASDMLYIGLFSTGNGTGFQWTSNDSTLSASLIAGTISSLSSACVFMTKANAGVPTYSVTNCTKVNSNVFVACELESVMLNSSLNSSNLFDGQCSKSKSPNSNSNSNAGAGKFNQPTDTQLQNSLVINSVGVAVFIPSSIAGMFLLMLSDTMNFGLSFLKRKRLLILAEIASFTLSGACFSLPYIFQTETFIKQTVLGFFFF
jgi:hypothetical protein